MKNHWDKHLNVKALIQERKPSVVVECGAGSGDNTKNLLEARDALGFRLVVINDDGGNFKPEEWRKQGVDWRSGISYLELQKFSDGEIDFCLIDTDHNYWTLKTELETLHPKMKPKGVCVIHDTETYGHESGHMTEYNTPKVPYPFAEIDEYQRMGLSLVAAIGQAVTSGQYRWVAQSAESHGAMALERL